MFHFYLQSYVQARALDFLFHQLPLEVGEPLVGGGVGGYPVVLHELLDQEWLTLQDFVDLPAWSFLEVFHKLVQVEVKEVACHR